MSTKDQLQHRMITIRHGTVPCLIKDKWVEKQTTINTDSTDDQIPSAKAVYDLLESALGEYITDIADLVGGDA